MHRPYAIRWDDHGGTAQDLDERITRADEAAKEWYDYWDGHFERVGISKTQFLRESCTYDPPLLYLSTFLESSVGKKTKRCLCCSNHSTSRELVCFSTSYPFF